MKPRRTVYHVLPPYLGCGDPILGQPGAMTVSEALADFEAALGDGRGIEKIYVDYVRMEGERSWSDGAYPGHLIFGMRQIVRRRCRPVPLVVHLSMPPAFYGKLVELSPMYLQGASVWGLRGQPEELLTDDLESFDEILEENRVRAPRPPSILIVHDEPDVKPIVRSFLESEGYRVCEAVDRVTCLDQFMRCRPALVIFLSYYLARTDVPSLIVELRTRLKAFHGAGLPVRAVVVSGYTDAEKKARAAEAGAEAWIGKPFEREPFLREVERLVGPCPPPSR